MFNCFDMMNVLGQEGDGVVVVEVCGEIEVDLVICCVILIGVGCVFFVGGDVKVMCDCIGVFVGLLYIVCEGYCCNIYCIVKLFYNFEVLLIVVVNGVVIGLGCDVVCMVDVWIVLDKVKFGVMFFKLGLIFGDGGVWLLL